MEILHVASECEPLAKTGGLADVLAGLPRAQARAGHDVTVVIPGYRQALDRTNARPSGPAIQVAGPVSTFWLQPYECEVEGVRTVLFRADELFDRRELYGTTGRDYADNGLRFLCFSRAAAALALLAARRPRIVHAHDWQAGLVVAIVALARPRPVEPRLVFTIHNLAYQGVHDGRIFPYTGLPEEALTPSGIEYYGDVSFLKAGLVYADALTTVSPNYAREIQTPELGRGLDGVIRARTARLQGIVNGIDAVAWDPSADPALVRSFARDDVGPRRENKAALLYELGLGPDLEHPLLATVARLDPQKGIDLIAAAAPDLVAQGARLAIVGTGDPAIESRLRELAERFPGRIAVRLAFDAALARRVYAGADVFLVPSRFEPCGLNQLYALRYGAVPVVRRTGGLADTVIDADAHLDTGTGFLFDEPTPEALEEAVRRALRAFADQPRFREIQRRGMARDSSWDGPARAYVGLYESLLEDARAAAARGRA